MLDRSSSRASNSLAAQHFHFWPNASDGSKHVFVVADAYERSIIWALKTDLWRQSVKRLRSDYSHIRYVRFEYVTQHPSTTSFTSSGFYCPHGSTCALDSSNLYSARTLRLEQSMALLPHTPQCVPLSSSELLVDASFG